MTLNKTLNGSSLTIAVEGRLDTVTSPELEAFVSENLEGVTELTFDFTNLEYISSAGLRVLLSSQKKMNTKGKMKVTGVNDTVNEIFEVTGFSDILTIE